ncbi:MAG: hypothetical protein CMP68_02480 [Flavobacteriales bacterium]|nr:hypothetical protein [Flavobacteriales bacterium]|tara:strand:+ start:16323 stop:16724 length:402 start_codon:yes stop_codon:yes gene_type:complete
MKKTTLFICLIFSSFYYSFSQGEFNLNQNLFIEKSDEIKKILKTYNSFFEKKVNVYKIQLYHNENRYSTWKVKKKYEELFPNFSADFFYEAPFFKVTTEYFMKKVAAEKKMKEIKNYFPDCFIIQIPLKEEKF